jgi:hypothetical protein
MIRQAPPNSKPPPVTPLTDAQAITLLDFVAADRLASLYMVALSWDGVRPS